MAKRRVKLVDTGEYSTQDQAYKAPNGKYYSSQIVYEQNLFQNEMRNKCIDKIFELFDIRKGMKISTIFFRKLAELEPYGYDVVYNTIEHNSVSIEWALNNKEFSSESGKVSYVMAIVQNNINDEYKFKQKQLKLQEKSAKIIEEPVDIEIVNNIQKTKDVSRWIE